MIFETLDVLIIFAANAKYVADALMSVLETALK